MDTVELVFVLRILLERINVDFLRINRRSECWVVPQSCTGHDNGGNCQSTASMERIELPG